MSASQNPVWSTLDAFDADIRAFGAPEAMRQLVGALARYRSEASCERWRECCAAIGSHPALAVLLEDPYSRDARRKPAGYAGDARTLDYVYLRDPGSPAPTPGGRALFDVATSVPIAAAVRDRSATLARYIASRAAHGPLRIASVACGHARELDYAADRLMSNVTYWGIDQDADSVRHCQSRVKARVVNVEVGSVRDVVAGRVRIPPSDLVYASGLFDYLEERAAAVLVRRMFSAVKPGGSLLVPNLTPKNEEVGYMEAVMDWWMVYRTETDMRRLALAASLGGGIGCVTMFSTSGGRVAWLRADRLGAAAADRA